jgi:hypothetical protein
VTDWLYRAPLAEELAGRVRVVPLADFAASDEVIAEPLVGDADKRLLPAGSTLVLYGEGGSGKTTLAIDLACHLAAGADWLSFPIGRPCRVLLLENEGPRAEFRLKLRRKLANWAGPDLANRVLVLEEPWAQIDLRRGQDAAELAGALARHEIDVLLAGPIRRLGLEGGGTPAETVAFMGLLDRVRRDANRPVAAVLVHHENKGGDISGAFEAEFDTVIHVKPDASQRTHVTFRKSRWSSRIHRRKAILGWVLDRDGFDVLQSDLDADTHAVARNAEDEAALEWVVAFVTTTPGVARGLAESAYCEAHIDPKTGKPKRGTRARARRAINTQETLAEELRNRPDDDPERRALLRLAIRNGERGNAKYLYPANHADSPLAEPPNGEPGEQDEQAHAGPPLARSPFPIEGTANGEHQAEVSP